MDLLLCDSVQKPLNKAMNMRVAVAPPGYCQHVSQITHTLSRDQRTYCRFIGN